MKMRHITTLTFIAVIALSSCAEVSAPVEEMPGAPATNAWPGGTNAGGNNTGMFPGTGVNSGGNPAPAVDRCLQNGWYGDGRCDTICHMPDPDCSNADDPGNNSTDPGDQDICTVEGRYGDGICDPCPMPDPDCAGENNGDPGNNSNVDPGDCVTTADFFEESVWGGFMSSTCFECHGPGGQGAAQSTLSLRSVGSQSDLDTNLNLVRSIASRQVEGVSIIMAKPSGQTTHGGGTLFSTSSPEYLALTELVDRFNSPEPDCGGDPGGNNNVDPGGQDLGNDGEIGDLCATEGWYNDGTCDTFCDMADPDCTNMGNNNGGEDDFDICEFLGVYTNGTCDWDDLCPMPDPDCM